MIKQVKVNKSLVWRKTYGKPFFIKKSIAVAQCAANTAQTVAQLSLICSANTDGFIKGLAIADAILAQAKSTSDILKISNKGFI
jgi:hypothetical protein